MSRKYEVPRSVAERAYVDTNKYVEMYGRSIQDNEEFWADEAARLDWIRPFSKVRDVSFAKDDLHIRWYYDGTLNACFNCVDRHLETRGEDVAIIWESDEPDVDLKITYRELHERVCRFARGPRLDATKRLSVSSYRGKIEFAHQSNSI